MDDATTQSAITTHGDRVRASILATGLDLMRTDPATLSARRIGKRLGLTHSAVLYHYGNAAALKDAVAAHAVAAGDAPCIRYLIAMRHPAVDRMPQSERSRWMRAG